MVITIICIAFVIGFMKMVQLYQEETRTDINPRYK